MDFQHVNVKFLVKDPEAVDLEPLIPVFHRWIQAQVCEELLLDIADYRHVPEGPGIVLIGHQADYSVDNTKGRLGVRYNRKATFDGTNQDRLKQAACSALKAFQRLEREGALGGKISFNGHDVELFINDRMLAPNRGDIRKAFEPDFKALFDRLFRGNEYSMSYDTDPRRLLGLSARSSTTFSIAELISNLSS
ncbi:MAG TPA: hypothetical protein VEJ38_04350 [Candidatus Acidoferrales bacterium]|nr:hypothetical protein [Candidatus Acidoferrales bacterium]